MSKTSRGSGVCWSSVLRPWCCNTEHFFGKTPDKEFQPVSIWVIIKTACLVLFTSKSISELTLSSSAGLGHFLVSCLSNCTNHVFCFLFLVSSLFTGLSLFTNIKCVYFFASLKFWLKCRSEKIARPPPSFFRKVFATLFLRKIVFAPCRCSRPGYQIKFHPYLSLFQSFTLGSHFTLIFL